MVAMMQHKNPMSFNDAETVAVRRNDDIIHFGGMSISQAVSRIKSVNLSEKAGQLPKKKEVENCDGK